MGKYCNNNEEQEEGKHSYLIFRNFGDRRKGFEMNLIIDIFKNSLEASYYEYKYNSGDSEFSGDVKINYCPMCGRKLESE